MESINSIEEAPNTRLLLNYDKINNVEEEANPKVHNTDVPVMALAVLLATGILVLATLFLMSFIYYHKCYKVKVEISKTDLESKGSILRLRGKSSSVGGRR